MEQLGVNILAQSQKKNPRYFLYCRSNRVADITHSQTQTIAQLLNFVFIASMLCVDIFISITYEEAIDTFKNKTRHAGRCNLLYRLLAAVCGSITILYTLDLFRYIFKHRLRAETIETSAYDMGHKGNDMKGGQGSIKVGATGRVSTLMTRELEDCNIASQKMSTNNVVVSVFCGVSTSSSYSAGGGSSCNSDQSSRVSILGKLSPKGRTCHHIPMLDSEDISVDKTIVKGNLQNKRSKLVEIVDLKCGRRSGKVCSGPSSNKAKRITFSRLSVSN